LRGKSRKDQLPLVVIHYSSKEDWVSHILSIHLGQAFVGFGVSYGTLKEPPQLKHRTVRPETNLLYDDSNLSIEEIYPNMPLKELQTDFPLIFYRIAPVMDIYPKSIVARHCPIS